MAPSDSDPEETERRQTRKWQKNFATIVGTILYIVPLFWMWSSDGYPDSFGIHITAHGRAGVFERWYSYLLVERHRALDVGLFAYMWLRSPDCLPGSRGVNGKIGKARNR